MKTFPDSLMLTLPDAWDDLPLEPDEYSRYVEAQTERLKDSGLLSRSDLRQFEMLLVALRSIIHDQRVVLAATYFQNQEELGAADADEIPDDREAVLLMASLAMSVARREDFQTDVPLRAEVIIDGLADDSQSEGKAVRYVALEPPTICEIAGLTAAKLVRVMTVETSPGEEFKQFSQTYMVPIAEGDAVVVMQFTTINVIYSSQFSELFDAIAQTLRILYPDQPTFPDGSARRQNDEG